MNFEKPGSINGIRTLDGALQYIDQADNYILKQNPLKDPLLRVEICTWWGKGKELKRNVIQREVGPDFNFKGEKIQGRKIAAFSVLDELAGKKGLKPVEKKEVSKKGKEKKKAGEGEQKLVVAKERLPLPGVMKLKDHCARFVYIRVMIVEHLMKERSKLIGLIKKFTAKKDKKHVRFLKGGLERLNELLKGLIKENKDFIELNRYYQNKEYNERKVQIKQLKESLEVKKILEKHSNRKGKQKQNALSEKEALIKKKIKSLEKRIKGHEIRFKKLEGLALEKPIKDFGRLAPVVQLSGMITTLLKFEAILEGCPKDFLDNLAEYKYFKYISKKNIEPSRVSFWLDNYMPLIIREFFRYILTAKRKEFEKFVFSHNNIDLTKDKNNSNYYEATELYVLFSKFRKFALKQVKSGKYLISGFKKMPPGAEKKTLKHVLICAKYYLKRHAIIHMSNRLYDLVKKEDWKGIKEIYDIYSGTWGSVCRHGSVVECKENDCRSKTGPEYCGLMIGTFFETKNVELFKLLINKSKDIWKRDNEGAKTGLQSRVKNELYFAIRAGHTENAKYLIDLGVDINSTIEAEVEVISSYDEIDMKFAPSSFYTRKDSVFSYAIRTQRNELAKHIFEKYSGIISQENYKLALNSCIDTGNLEMLKKIEKASSIELKGIKDLDKTSFNGNIKMLKYLMTNGYQPPYSIFQRACRRGHLDMVKYFLKSPGLSQALEKDPQTLNAVVYSGHKDSLKILEHLFKFTGVGVNTRENKKAGTPLFSLIWNLRHSTVSNSYEKAMLLLKKGAKTCINTGGYLSRYAKNELKSVIDELDKKIKNDSKPGSHSYTPKKLRVPVRETEQKRLARIQMYKRSKADAEKIYDKLPKVPSMGSRFSSSVLGLFGGKTQTSVEEID